MRRSLGVLMLGSVVAACDPPCFTDVLERDLVNPSARSDGDRSSLLRWDSLEYDVLEPVYTSSLGIIDELDQLTPVELPVRTTTRAYGIVSGAGRHLLATVEPDDPEVLEGWIVGSDGALVAGPFAPPGLRGVAVAGGFLFAEEVGEYTARSVSVSHVTLDGAVTQRLTIPMNGPLLGQTAFLSVGDGAWFLFERDGVEGFRLSSAGDLAIDIVQLASGDMDAAASSGERALVLTEGPSGLMATVLDATGVVAMEETNIVPSTSLGVPGLLIPFRDQGYLLDGRHWLDADGHLVASREPLFEPSVWMMDRNGTTIVAIERFRNGSVADVVLRTQRWHFNAQPDEPIDRAMVRAGVSRVGHDCRPSSGGRVQSPGGI